MIAIEHKDCFEFLAGVEPESVDFVCIDPPYGILKGHKIEQVVDIERLTGEFFRVLKQGGFYAFFGMMPTMIPWHNQADSLFEYREHITWVKRVNSSPYMPILRMKEEILIYSKGSARYYVTKGNFEDIKLPMFMDGLYTRESLHRHISEISRYKKTVQELQHCEDLQQFKDTLCRLLTDKKEIKSKKTNDAYYGNIDKEGDRCPVELNVCNVWSFMPENKTGFGAGSSNFKHPTVKPVKLVERLIELCMPAGGLVLDCFLGSGSTAVAAKNQKRRFRGCELDIDYYDMSCGRVNDTMERLL